MIFGFTFTSKKGKWELRCKRTTGFTLILTRGTRGWGRKKATKGGSGSPLFIICRSECFSTTAIKTATAVYLSRPEELPTRIKLDGPSEAEGNLSGNIGERGQ
jgi:hypothetical protein